MLTLCLAAVHSAWRASRAADGPVPPLAPFPLPVGSGIFLLGGLQPAAAYVVETSAGLVLIDAGLRSDAAHLKAQMARLGLDWTRIRAILLTHAHWDHCGGAEHLRSKTGARIHAGAGDAEVLRMGGPREALYSAFDLPPEAEFHPTTVDVTLKGGETLSFGEVQFQALALPGHTPGSVCYLMERPGLRALFAGDVISMLQGDENAPQRIGRPLGTYSAYLPPRFRGDAGAYLASLRALRALPVPDLVLPGHPRADPTPQQPRLSAGRWAELLDRGIAEMTALAARYQADGADFLDGEPKELLPGLDYLGDTQGRAVYTLRFGSQSVLIDAPGGTGLRWFLENRLTRLGRRVAGPTAVLLTSCDPESTSGLSGLMEWSRPDVVAAASEIEAVRRRCPRETVLWPVERWPGATQLGMTAVPLRGPGSGSVAFRAGLAGKVVLFTGAFPLGGPPDGGPGRLAEFAGLRAAILDYLVSVFRLREPRPDLWLPAAPSSGQNANLYDEDWQIVIDESLRHGHRLLNLVPGPILRQRPGR